MQPTTRRCARQRSRPASHWPDAHSHQQARSPHAQLDTGARRSGSRQPRPTPRDHPIGHVCDSPDHGGIANGRNPGPGSVSSAQHRCHRATARRDRAVVTHALKGLRAFRWCQSDGAEIKFLPRRDVNTGANPPGHEVHARCAESAVAVEDQHCAHAPTLGRADVLSSSVPHRGHACAHVVVRDRCWTLDTTSHCRSSTESVRDRDEVLLGSHTAVRAAPVHRDP